MRREGKREGKNRVKGRGSGEEGIDIAWPSL